MTDEVYRFMEGEHSIAQARFMTWAESSDPELVELALHAVSCCNDRIDPPVDEKTYFEILLRAIRISLTARKDSEWLSPYLLSRTLLSFLDDLATRTGKSEYSAFLTRLEDSLYRLAREDGQLDERALVDGYLEHLFEDEGRRELFSRWKGEPRLAGFYREACEWSS